MAAENPASPRSKGNKRLLEQIRHSWNERDGVYGSPRVFIDLREAGERYGENRVAKPMKENGISAFATRRGRSGSYAPPGQASSNVLDRKVDREELDTAWVSYIIYIRTREGWLHPVVVMDLASRRIIGWPIQDTRHPDSAIQALLAVVWRRRAERGAIIHSDRGPQYAGDDRVRFYEEYNLVRSTSRRGNADDNVAMESFSASLNKKRVRWQTYRTIAEARADSFDYIEVFYNRKRRHEHLGGMSPVEFEGKKLIAWKWLRNRGIPVGFSEVISTTLS